MNRPRLGALAIAALGVVAIALAVVTSAGAADTLDPEKALVVSKTAALEEVADFVGIAAARLSASDPVEGIFDRFYRITGPEISATVDVHDGSITTLVLGGIVVPNGGVRIGSDDALAIARGYLDSHELQRSGMAETIEVIDHGESVEYLVTWQRLDGGIIVPDIRQIGVDAASGKVFRYHNLFRPYTPPGNPTVNEVSAILAARSATYLGATPIVQKAELRIGFDPAGTQYLAWHIYLDGPAADQPEGQNVLTHFIIEVDAVTGKATIVAQG